MMIVFALAQHYFATTPTLVHHEGIHKREAIMSTEQGEDFDIIRNIIDNQRGKVWLLSKILCLLCLLVVVVVLLVLVVMRTRFLLL